jgi:O-antigen/teichoic acid export membrane protein
MSAHNRLDAFLLERLRADGARQAGIYAMAYRLLDAGNIAGFLTGSFLVPFLSRHQHNKALLQQVILFSRHGLLFLAAGVVAFAAVFAPWLLRVLYHSSDTYSSTVLQLCLFSLPAYYLTHVYGSVLTATARFRPFIQVLVLAVVFNTALNLWLIPRYGAAGCCVAALFSQYGCGVLLWLVASRRLSLSPSVSTALLYPAAAVLSGVCFWLGLKLTGNVWIILSSIALVLLLVFTTQRNNIRKVILSFYK